MPPTHEHQTGAQTGSRRAVPVHTSTYRLQLTPAFTFSDAQELLPYLVSLGVTACYLSPPFTARPGSTHGYDVCNHNELSPELGGRLAFRDLARALREAGLGLILDFVPNHMGVDPATNEWWRDVLENGPSSPFSGYFDIDWHPLKPELKNRLLLPILGEQYGDALESGNLRLTFEAGALVVTYNGIRLPVNPRRAPVVFEADLQGLAAALGESDPQLREFLSVLTALRNLPAYTESDSQKIVERQREKEVARERLCRLVDTSAPIRRYVDDAVSRFNGTVGNLASFTRLHSLLEQQAYRLASWRTASDEINYRRFFDINELAGLRVEEPEVFDTLHRLVLELIGEGLVTGLRIDHIDGLLDPAAYLKRLRAAAGAAGSSESPFYVVVEKILSGSERLASDWAVAGTTGYNFLNDVNGLFVSGRNARAMRRGFARVTGHTDPLVDVMYNAKRLIISTAMTSEFQVIANAVNRISERDWRSRDFTLGSIVRALREVLACFPVYRTYVSDSGISAEDRAVVDAAIRAAQSRNPATEPSIFAFLRTVLLPERTKNQDGAGTADRSYEERLKVASRFQQYSAPVQAKGIEDTAAYRHVELLSLNEVGGDLQQFGRTVAAFHQSNRHRLAEWPLEMTTTATHDTKRGEDARARLNVLSEIPAEWRDCALACARINRSRHAIVDGRPAPDRHDEHHFYQALLAIWPADRDRASSVVIPGDVRARLRDYMIKAVREAKVHTSWVNPNPAYEAAIEGFVEDALSPSAAAFLAAFAPLADRVARLGAVNSLAQLVLKVASPGIPDFYQGSELWDLTLVDPDNRRPVDFRARRTALEGLRVHLQAGAAPAAGGHERAMALDGLLDHWTDGRIKLLVTAIGLRLRRATPELFLSGSYRALEAEGLRSHHVVAFARQHGRECLVAVVPRLVASLDHDNGWPLGHTTWGDTRLRLPRECHGLAFRHLMTGEPITTLHTGSDEWLAMAQVFERCPVALLLAGSRTGGAS